MTDSYDEIDFRPLIRTSVRRFRQRCYVAVRQTARIEGANPKSIVTCIKGEPLVSDLAERDFVSSRSEAGLGPSAWPSRLPAGACGDYGERSCEHAPSEARRPRSKLGRESVLDGPQMNSMPEN
jgi:hypothetical protein